MIVTHLVMSKSHPIQQVLRHSEDVSQDVDLEFIERLVHRRLEQRLELVQSILDFQLRLWIFDIAVRIGVRNGRAVVGVAEAQPLGRCRQQPRFETGDGLVDEVVDGVDDIVYQGLPLPINAFVSKNNGRVVVEISDRRNAPNSPKEYN